ncbi:YqcC family protein [Marinobacter piscensis]|uniref:YqcC family protein n=1 Tax=Marinobacter piscensis TaxID=1562308 RepID=UPI0011AA0CE9|nr:YqcC family protein [Marinobacter piscensis]
MTDTGTKKQVADRLLGIEIELRRLRLWEHEQPPAEAFQSTQPFCIDTLEFTQWVQFVFLERMKFIIESAQPLPKVAGIAPMAEEHFRGRSESGQNLIQELEAVDQLLSDN